jgi:hypothetical protein
MTDTPPAATGMQTMTRPILYGLAIGLVIGLVLNGYMWMNMRSTLSGQEAQCAALLTTAASEKTELEGQIATLNGEVASAKAYADLLGARILVARAIYQLDQRNFGLANGYVAQAAKAVADADAAVAGVDAGKLEKVKGVLGGLNLQVATDLMAQRLALADAAASMDALLSR